LTYIFVDQSEVVFFTASVYIELWQCFQISSWCCCLTVYIWDKE